MEEFAQMMFSYLKAADTFLWGPPLLVLLLGTHLFYTIRLRFVQRHLGAAFKLVMQKDNSTDGNVAPFAALAVALASTIGTGNVIGVATAVVLGGPGAVLWCMITGMFGMATKYAESLLAVKFRIRDVHGEVHGGPMYTILRGLGWRWMAIIFAVVAGIAVLGTGNLVQSNAIAVIVNKTFSIPFWLTGVLLALLIGLVIVGGLQSIAKVCTYMVPFMSFIYLAACITLLVMNFEYLGTAVVYIVKSAFSAKAAFGGVVFGMMEAARYGIARGLFSNEAGMGSEPIVAATACTRNAVRQGLVSYTGTFCTIIICLMTGLVLVSSTLAFPDKITLVVGNEILTQNCFEQIPYVGKYLLAFAIFAFASTTLLGWFYYGEQCFRFLFKSDKALMFYKIVYTAIVFTGSVSSLTVAWDFANFANGLMVIPNVISLLLLQKVVVAETKKYLWSGKLDMDDPRCIRGNTVAEN